MNKCKQVGMLTGGKWDNCHDICRRVYSADAVSPTLVVQGGGNQEVKILEEPIIYDDYNGHIKADQSAIGSLTTNSGNTSTRNGVKIIEPTYRVRKLTERECGKLMGVKPCDIVKIGKNLSKSAQYHCFGDSIVTTCLMALFGQMLNVDWKSKVENTVKEILENENDNT